MVTFTKITEQVYVLTDRAGCCGNLVIGKERALLFDLGIGADDFGAAARSLTDLPLTVILSHGHIDHIGGSVYFDEVFMRQEERSVFVEYSDEIVTGWMKDMCGKELPEDYKYDCRGWVQIKDLEMGSFDLGDLPCEIISLQGHTIGSVGIYLPTLRLLLSGDALTPVMCMNFTNHMGLEELAGTIRMVQNMEIDYYLTSHHNYLMPKEQLAEMLVCLDNVPNARFMEYQYATPPYDMGWFTIHRLEGEPIGLIMAYDTPGMGKKKRKQKEEA